jgi:prevent-host-death family protein
MDAITDTEVQKNFTAVMNQVCDDHAPIIMTRESEAPVVIISLEDYNAIEETLYLLQSPKNAERLTKALQELKQENYQKHDLIEVE